MPRKPLPRWPKGTRPPNSGRKKGTPNRISVEARELAAQLVTDVFYQQRLRRDFVRRKVHPTIESLVWAYHLGRPAQPVNVAGGLQIDVNARIEEERRIFAALDLRDLEMLAAESQALVERAAMLAKVATGRDDPPNPSANPSVSDSSYYVNPQGNDDGKD